MSNEQPKGEAPEEWAKRNIGEEARTLRAKAIGLRNRGYPAAAASLEGLANVREWYVRRLGGSKS